MAEAVIATCYGAANAGQLAGAMVTELAEEGLDCALARLLAAAIDKDTSLDKMKSLGIS